LVTWRAQADELQVKVWELELKLSKRKK
jgi:hypothetical protein